jgi:hypothetical protein
MSEPNRVLKAAGGWLLRLSDILSRHRTVYAGLSICHAAGSMLAENPELYGTTALLYAMLAVRR